MDLGTVKIINIQDILFDASKRGRQDYGNIAELAQSIKEQGLIEPLVVYSPKLEPPFELIAGGRRYKALQMLGATLVSVRIYDHELSERERKVIELFENLRRKDLSFIEQANMTRALNDTLKSIHGQKLLGGASTVGHSTRDTARLLGVTNTTVLKSLKISEMHEQFPELGLEQKKNAAAALHTIDRLTYAAKTVVANPNIAASPVAESYRIGDFLTTILPRGKYSFIEIDPPYGIDLEDLKRDRTIGNKEGYIDVAEDEYISFLERLIKICTYAATDNAYLVLWAPPQWYYHMYNILIQYGWNPDHVPAVWVKTNSNGQSRSAEHWLGGSYEPFIYARRGSARLCKEGRSNVFNYPVVLPHQKIHPTEKPYELMRDIINTFCHPNGNILVPFAGSGVTIATAYDMGHQVIGYDLNESYRQEFLTKFVGASV
jgi:ParB/RepB/Spo0J family partition protein